MQSQQLQTKFEFLIAGGYGGEDKIKKGIFDTTTQTISELDVVHDQVSPFYFEQHKDLLYSVSFIDSTLVILRMKKDGQYETLQQVSLGGKKAKTEVEQKGDTGYINEHALEGQGPCFFSFDEKRQFLMVANYTGGSNWIYRLNEDGTIVQDDVETPYQKLVQNQLEKSDHPRQDKAHSHFIVQVPGSNLFVSSDLGADAIFTYEINSENKFVPFQTIRVPKSSGPRHIAFNEKGDTIYIIGELASTLMIFSFDKNTRQVEYKQSVESLSEEDKNTDKLSSHINYRNGYIYMGNRIADTFSVFREKENYEVEKLQYHKTGAWPWHQEFTPDGNFLVTTNTNTNDLSIFKVEDHLLNKVKDLPIPHQKPTCIQFIKEF